MRKILVSCSSVLLLVASLHAFAAEKAKATFTVTTQSEVPGLALHPGNYSIQVVGRLADRTILRVDDEASKTHADFIAIANSGMQTGLKAGVTNWDVPVDGTTYVRGWVPPGSASMVEFVYPKAQAVAIAKLNQKKVPAIDPASEGRGTDPTLSKEDMQLVTLWLLSSVRVGPADAPAEIKAERYQVASLERPKPVISRLPHTASDMPLLLLISLGSLALAMLFRWQILNTPKP